MQSSTGDDLLEAPPTLAQGAALWSELTAALDARAVLDATIVRLTGRLQRSGTIEALEGLTLDAVLSLSQRLPRSDRAMLLLAAEVLADMPVTEQLFDQGALTWGIVRGIVTEAKRLARDQRAALDERVAASQDRVVVMDPDDVLDAIAVAAAELRDPRSLERSEDRAAAGNFVWVQPGLFGRGRAYAELDNLSLSAVLNGIDAVTPLDDGQTLAQRRADGLVNLAAHRCAADTAADAAGVNPVTGEVLPDRQPAGLRGGSNAVALIDAVVDISDVSINAAGTISINAPGCLPVLSARVVEALAGDATVRAVLVDGARPLTVTKKVHAKTIPTPVRSALAARDRGDRFPGSRAPAKSCDAHHFDKTGQGHHVDHVALLSPASHRRVHRHGWRADLDPATATITWTHHERTWSTLPRGTRLRRAQPDRDQDTSGKDPPVP